MSSLWLGPPLFAYVLTSLFWWSCSCSCLTCSDADVLVLVLLLHCKPIRVETICFVRVLKTIKIHHSDLFCHSFQNNKNSSSSTKTQSIDWKTQREKSFQWGETAQPRESSSYSPPPFPRWRRLDRTRGAQAFPQTNSSCVKGMHSQPYLHNCETTSSQRNTMEEGTKLCSQWHGSVRVSSKNNHPPSYCPRLPRHESSSQLPFPYQLPSSLCLSKSLRW